MSGKPRIAVSACLLGEPVRYDGRDRRDEWIAEVLAKEVDLIPVCPEVAIGMGVPRDPIRVNMIRGESRAQGVDDPERDMTDSLIAYAAAQSLELHDIDGFIFKGRSPSCGLGSTPLYMNGQEQPQHGNGLFAGELSRRRPDLPVAEETGLQQPQQQEEFIQAVHGYHTARQKTGSKQ